MPRARSGGSSGLAVPPQAGAAGGAISSLAVRPAEVADLDAVRALLAAANLPLDGMDEAFEHGVVAVEDGLVVGAAAVEPYGTDGLLRSVVVNPTRRGSGLGRAVVAAAEASAGQRGIRDLYLLTETAIGWFPRLGYAPLDRDAAPAGIAGSLEFTTSCVDTGILMHRRLPATG